MTLGEFMWIQDLCGIIAVYSAFTLVFLPIHFYLEDNTGCGRIRGGYPNEKELMKRFNIWLYCFFVFLASFLIWLFL